MLHSMSTNWQFCTHIVTRIVTKLDFRTHINRRVCAKVNSPPRMRGCRFARPTAIRLSSGTFGTKDSLANLCLTTSPIPVRCADSPASLQLRCALLRGVVGTVVELLGIEPKFPATRVDPINRAGRTFQPHVIISSRRFGFVRHVPAITFKHHVCHLVHLL